MRPIPTSTFRKFLKHIGCIYVRTKGSHEVWDRKEKPLPRPIIFRGSKREIPPTHIRTNLATLGISIEEFERIIKEF